MASHRFKKRRRDHGSHIPFSLPLYFAKLPVQERQRPAAERSSFSSFRSHSRSAYHCFTIYRLPSSAEDKSSPSGFSHTDLPLPSPSRPETAKPPPRTPDGSRFPDIPLKAAALIRLHDPGPASPPQCIHLKSIRFLCLFFPVDHDLIPHIRSDLFQLSAQDMKTMVIIPTNIHPQQQKTPVGFPADVLHTMFFWYYLNWLIF